MTGDCTHVSNGGLVVADIVEAIHLILTGNLRT